MIISLEDMKAHLNVTSDADDALIEAKIHAAQASVEAFVGADLNTDFDPCPEPLKEAVRQLAASFYENREATIVGVDIQTTPFSVHELIRPYRRWVF